MFLIESLTISMCLFCSNNEFLSTHSQILQEEFEDISPREKLKRFILYVGGMIIMHFISEYSAVIHEKSLK